MFSPGKGGTIQLPSYAELPTWFKNTKPGKEAMEAYHEEISFRRRDAAAALKSLDDELAKVRPKLEADVEQAEKAVKVARKRVEEAEQKCREAHGNSMGERMRLEGESSESTTTIKPSASV